jgi:FkbM family methyltransferase
MNDLSTARKISRFFEAIETSLYRLAGLRRSHEIFPSLLREAVAKQRDFYFVQIGAFDGDTADPLFALAKELRLRGCLVEPQRTAFERLKLNYAFSNAVTFECAAIADADGPTSLYVPNVDWLRQRGVKWSDPLAAASLSRDQVVRQVRKYAGEAPPECIDTERIETLSFSSLVAKHGIDRIDLLQIDTEGHDGKILSMIDLERWRPRLIHWEQRFLARREKQQLSRRLRRIGYRIQSARANAIAVLRS